MIERRLLQPKNIHRTNRLTVSNGVIMKNVAAIVAIVVAAVVVVTEAGYIAPYTALDHAVHHSGAYYDDHYAGLGYAAPYAAYYGNPSGTYSYWGSHGPTVVQENAASLAHPIAAHAPLYAPYSALYGAYGGPAVKTTVVQANVGDKLANHWGYPAAYGAYGYGYAHGYDKYLTASTAVEAPLAKYLW
ncbi:AGAP008450-PA-like protein [Anopheles sinensis]|uniref:AGAP008450-PA-like protein n=1 Tax=Anopheles sinensis TaxID=74873 RepID=A0A084W1W6_ANOSI|nr:AGAP008450-PA-like protein [Anopheles sinensis]